MRERGSVSVEFAAALPLVAVAMLLVAQIGLLVSEQLAVQHAAREGARAAAIWNDDAQAKSAALEAGALDEDRARIEISPAYREVGMPVTVSITYRPAAMPVAGAFLPAGARLRATVSMRTERAQP